jgi:hypothetical protein
MTPATPPKKHPPSSPPTHTIHTTPRRTTHLGVKVGLDGVGHAAHDLRHEQRVGAVVQDWCVCVCGVCGVARCRARASEWVVWVALVDRNSSGSRRLGACMLRHGAHRRRHAAPRAHTLLPAASSAPQRSMRRAVGAHACAPPQLATHLLLRLGAACGRWGRAPSCLRVSQSRAQQGVCQQRLQQHRRV